MEKNRHIQFFGSGKKLLDFFIFNPQVVGYFANAYGAF